MHMNLVSRSTLAVLGMLILPAVLLAHHGTGISYDLEHPWTAPAVVVEFKYVNPHAQLFFEVRDGEHKGRYSGEMYPNPAALIANGWTRKRSTEALPVGAEITVTVAPSRAGGDAVVVTGLRNKAGEPILVGGGPNPGGRGGGRGGN